MTHYFVFKWAVIKVSGPEGVTDDAVRHLDMFSYTMDEVVEHFEQYDELQVKRLT